jgi:probable HAF family extracellular repeat protein
MSGLGYLPGGSRSIATGTNSNGSVVVGWGTYNFTGAPEAFRWTASTGMVGLGFLPGGNLSQATATNPDGSVVVGNTNQGEAFLWTAKKGMVGLSGLNQANALNAKGSIVVGQSATLNATVWTHQTGAESIQQLLLADGVNLAGWVLLDATGISADGTIIVGDGTDPQGNNEAWIADIPHIRNLTPNGHGHGLTLFDSIISADDPVAPIPTALPLFATGLGGLGLLGWRRKRKVRASA